uniref:WAT1-related protein n=1 Tax=Solanum lycopersicum TaxID=4081 RepID=K4BR22_SOLLC
MGVKVVIGDMLPCTSMIIIEACTIFLTIMASTTFVFVVYTNALSFILLIPFSIFFHRNNEVTIAQNLAFAGLSYSSPIVARGAANMIPTFSFIIAIILRKIRIDLKRQGSIVRVIESLLSIMGILAMTFYKGPVVKQHSPSFLHLATSPHFFIITSNT